MQYDISPYLPVLNETKWMSKLDFIYRVKSSCDCTQGHHRRFLQLLYNLDFRLIRRSKNKAVVLQ